MAQQTIDNGDSGLDARTKINDNFTELYADVAGPPYPMVTAYADLPAASGSGSVYLVQTSTGAWPTRRPAGLWRDTGSWAWLGNFTWTAEELVNVPAGAIVATNVQAALNELDADLSSHIGVGGSQHPDVIAAGASGFMTGADKTKLNGIATGATANSADATLLARANHTGTQTASTVSDFSEAVDDRVAALLVAGSNVTLTYNDGAGTLTVASSGGGGSSNSFIYQNSDYTLTSTTSAQKVFNQTTNGRVTLTAGLYSFELIIDIDTMSATSGNADFDILGAGTATVNHIIAQAVGIDNNNELGTGARSGDGIRGTGVISLATNGTGTGVFSNIRGLIRITTGGTLIPSVALATAAAAVVRTGTTLRFTPVAADGVFSSGDFD